MFQRERQALIAMAHFSFSYLHQEILYLFMYLFTLLLHMNE